MDTGEAGQEWFFSHFTGQRGECVTRTDALDGMHMKRQMHSARSIKMQISFIRVGNICVRGESVFRPSAADPPPTVSKPLCVCVCVCVCVQRRGYTGRRVVVAVGAKWTPARKTARAHPLGQIFILRPIRRIDGPFSLTGHAEDRSLERTVTNFNWYHLLHARCNSVDKWFSNGVSPLPSIEAQSIDYKSRELTGEGSFHFFLLF